MTSVEVGGMVTDLKTLSVKPNVIFDSGFASGLIPVAVHELLVRKVCALDYHDYLIQRSI